MIKNLFSNRTPFEKCYLVENVKQFSFIPGNRNLSETQYQGRGGILPRPRYPDVCQTTESLQNAAH